jgi:hypothetical protein
MVGRIFVVGCPRSGTTLVQSLLAAHSHIVSFTESHLFDKGFVSIGRWSFIRRQRLQAFAAKFVAENPGIAENGGPRLLACDQHVAAASMARLIISTFDDAAHAYGASYWVEKTPDHVFRIPLIRSAAPDARFIHVVRRADGVLPSLHQASREWGRAKSWLSCAVHWTAALWESALHSHGQNHVVVTYEDFLEDQRAVLQALIAWLGLPWEESVLTDVSKGAAQCVAPEETWKARNMQGGVSAPPRTSPSAGAPSWARAIALLGPYGTLRRRRLRG